MTWKLGYMVVYRCSETGAVFREATESFLPGSL